MSDIVEKPHFSKVLPNLQVAVDSTSISLLQECARKFYYVQVLDYHARGSSIHLAFGGMYAKVLENFRKLHRTGTPYDEAVFLGVKECLEWDDSPFASDTKNFPYKNRHTLARTFIWYAEQYRHDVFETLVLEDGRVAAELSFRLALDIEAPGGEPFVLCGHLDELGTFQGEYFFKDDKTTKSALTDSYFAGFNPNTQMTNYFAASQVILHEPAKGGIVDAVQLGVNFSRFARRFVHRTPAHMDEWRKHLHYTLNLAIRYAEEDFFPMNTNACGNYGGCAFRSICALSPDVREDFLKADFEQWVWNPLEIRGD